MKKKKCRRGRLSITLFTASRHVRTIMQYYNIAELIFRLILRRGVPRPQRGCFAAKRGILNTFVRGRVACAVRGGGVGMAKP